MATSDIECATATTLPKGRPVSSARFPMSASSGARNWSSGAPLTPGLLSFDFASIPKPEMASLSVMRDP